MAQRLPIPGSDDGTWGDILNGFLEVSHASDGTLNANTVGTSQLQGNSVGTSQIQNNAVINAQLDTTTQTTLASVAGKYVKPGGGIPSTDMTNAVQTSLGLANSSVQTVNSKTPTSGNVSLGLSDLSDTNAVSGASNSQVLQYNGAKWVPATVSTTTVTSPTVLASSTVFPSTGVLDNFHRSNGGLGSNWNLVDPNYPLPAVSSNVATGTGQISGYWTTLFGADQEIRTHVADFNDTNNLMLRLGNMPTTSETGYEARFGSTTVVINRVQAPTRTQLVSVSRLTNNAPWIGFRAIGDTLSIWESSDGVTWQQITSVTDSYFRRDGYIGYFRNTGTTTLTMWAGGTINQDPTAGAYRFDGTSNGASFGLGNATITNAFTLLCVAKIHATASGGLVDMLTTDRINMFFESSGALQTYDGTTQTGGSTNPIAGRWALYAVVRPAGGTAQIPQFYSLDLVTGAVSQTSGGSGIGPVTAANGWTIGYSSQFAGHRIDADIACSAIWKSALTSTQILGINGVSALLALSPDWCVRMNQLPPFSDQIGNAQQLSLAGGAHSVDPCPNF